MIHVAEILVQYVAIQEKDGAERLVLRRSGNGGGGRERCEECRHVGRTKLGGMLLAMEQDEPANPMDVSLFGSPAVVPRTNLAAHPIK
jgi:hypothetical protein